MTAAAKPRIRVRTDGFAYPAPALPSARPAPSASYMRGGELPLFFRWNPALREASDDVKSAWRLATARTIDQFHNSGWLAGGADKSVAQVIGPNGLQLNAKPNAVALRWTQDQANQWARGVETRFSIWLDNPRACDAGARFSASQLQAQAYRHWLATGEVLASIPWIKYQGSSFGTKLKVLPAWRLSNKSEPPNLINGVRVNGVGAPVGYMLKRKNAYGGEDEVEVAANDMLGRPLVIHLFDGEPDQVRGISPFVSVLKVCRQFDQLADATLTAALIQAVFAAMFKSNAPPEGVLSAMQSGSEAATDLLTMQASRADWYKKTDLNLGISGKILHGFPGDELQFFRSEHPNDTYEPFAKFLLREGCTATALTYEEFTGDWAGATFSSSKMGVATNWPRVLYRRKVIAAPLMQRVYEAWLEEDIESGMTPFPGGVAGYLENKEAAAQANWRGPTMPQADELKSAMAAKTLKEIGFPDSFIYEPYGLDRDDVYEERKREQDRKAQLGLTDETSEPNPVRDALVTQQDKANG